MSNAVMDFDFFEAGMVLGTAEIALAPLVREWDVLFPPGVDDTRYAPSGLLVAVMMRGYLTIADRRPPGNVHAGQRLRWGIPAARDALLTVGLRCIAKERRGDRPWIALGATVDDACGTRHLDGEMWLLWAA